MTLISRCNTPRNLAASLVLCVSSTASAVDVNANAALTSDYVWRGSSQTLEQPAVQAGFKLATESGWYASAWGSNVDFGAAAGANSEFDLVGGWSGALAADWALDVNLTHYRYPASNLPLNWTELDATLTWKNTWLLVGHSNDALASGANGTYMQLGAKWPLADRFRIEGVLAHYALSAYDDGYAHASLSAVWTVRTPFELRLTAHATDSAAKDIFPGLAGSRIEAAVQASF